MEGPDKADDHGAGWDGTPAGLGPLLEEVSHLLPQQAPLHAFVHHNPLHAFEHLPFERAAIAAGELLAKEPFQSEDAFAAHLESGRIEQRDLEAAVDQALDGSTLGDAGGLSRRDFLIGRLRHLFEVPRGASLEWVLQESNTLVRLHPGMSPARRREILSQARRVFGGKDAPALEARVCEALWASMVAVAPLVEGESLGPRPRDRIRATLGVDTDEWVHPLLIRLCAAFLDQGIAYWSMPYREHGFLGGFRQLYGLDAGPPDRWMAGLSTECARQQREGLSAEETVVWALRELAAPEHEWARVVRETLLSLPGWAGMMRRFETCPEQAPVEPRPARLVDYLAVQLMLDVFAARHALESGAGEGLEAERTGARRDLELAYEAYIAAQLLDTDVAGLLESSGARTWIEAIRATDAIERRRFLHRAYERRHRVGVLDGLQAHERLLTRRPPEPEFQAVFCIDDREESLRRHLEEVFPGCETFGYAGFFGVAMVYQGLDDIHGRPLCPVAIEPKHLIVEHATDPAVEREYRSERRQRGVIRHGLTVGSKTLARGSALTALVGLGSVLPLIGRCLFPRTAERWAHRFHGGAVHGPTTRLAVAKDAADSPRDGTLSRGYSTVEMADIVESLLRTTGIAESCRSLVMIVGHGSSSLNNPHEAAHDCGATGGGRGGPNARAFAAMANEPEVRALLRQRKLSLPGDVWFVGAYHNTCDDSMTYYDEDLVPAESRPGLARAQDAMKAACDLDAHERCRRFLTSPRRIDVDDAVAHVETRAVDLAQPRPEFGHATNAVCIVGRRWRTRGLFLDRRAFLVSYDPTTDLSGEVLAKLLLAVGPVGAGINLEYYFSFVDPTGYGCGTKLPHNIAGLFGVMDGHASDLRTGLPWQMVEIHEPVRLLLVVEAEVETLEGILAAHPGLDRLIRNEWVQLVSWSPESEKMQVFSEGAFQPYEVESSTIPTHARSAEFYAGKRDHLGCAHLTASFGVSPT